MLHSVWNLSGCWRELPSARCRARSWSRALLNNGAARDTTDLSCVSEISANKYALNIRFLGIAGMDRGAVYDGDVEFELMFCNL